MKRIYIAGPITGLPRERVLHRFGQAEQYLTQEGFIVLNPTVLPHGLERSEHMYICLAMLHICDGIYLLDGWEQSKGAKIEFVQAAGEQKQIYYEGDL